MQLTRKVNPALIPNLVSTKSYLAGSSGQISRNPSVISIAHLKSAFFLRVNPSFIAILCMCVSVGTIKSLGRKTFQPPGSTSSLRTSHFKNKNRRLHALLSSGAVTRGKLPGFLPRDNLSENPSSPENISPSETFRHSRRNSSRLPYSRRTSATFRSKVFMSSAVVNLCLKSEGTTSALSFVSRNLCGSSVRQDSTRSTLFMICATRP